MNYIYKENESFWDSNFSKKINNEFIKFNAELQENKYYSEYLLAQQEYNNSVNNYKKEHNEFLYIMLYLFLFFSIILIIPLYWHVIKIKKLKSNKKRLLQEFKQKDEKCIETTKLFSNNINLFNYINNCFNLFSIEAQGPITNELVSEMEKFSLFDWSFNTNINPHNSYWSIFDKNKILISYCQQEQYWSKREYVGSISIPMIIKTGNSYSTHYKTITASYFHPYVEVLNHKHINYLFLKSCEKLEFQFEATKKRKLFNKNLSLENSHFNKKFNWINNDEAQFRMIFTPHKQELLVNELNVNKHYSEITDRLFKTNNFIYNNFEFNSKDNLLNEINNIRNEFVNKSNIDLTWFLKEISKIISSYFFDFYSSNKFLWTTPLINSENHRDIINNANKKHYPEWMPYYIISKIIKKPIIKKNTNCFNKLINCTKINYKNINIESVIFEGTSFSYVNKIKEVNVGKYVVPVQYVDCVPSNKQIEIYYKQIDNNFSHINFNLFNNLFDNLIKDEKVVTIIDEIKKEKFEFYIEDSFIVFVNRDNEYTIESILENLYKIYNCFAQVK